MAITFLSEDIVAWDALKTTVLGFTTAWKASRGTRVLKHLAAYFIIAFSKKIKIFLATSF
jgi:hypothetical protein